jgi:hypothetical protein
MDLLKMPNEPNKLYLDCDGDPSVGIQPSQMVLDLGGIIIEEEDREEFGKCIADAIGGFFAEGYGWSYSDECVECRARLINGKCPDKNCIANMY